VHEINVKMLTEGRLADSEWWVEDKDYSNAAARCAVQHELIDAVNLTRGFKHSERRSKLADWSQSEPRKKSICPSVSSLLSITTSGRR
jgi:hypothetical protein